MGFFDDAEVDLNDIPDDEFGFGRDFWHIRIVEVDEPKVTKNQDKIGMMVKWAVMHEAYNGDKRTQQMRQWIQLPVPKEYQGTIPWHPKENVEDKKVLVNLRKLFVALGFSNDEMGGVDGAKMLYRGCLSTINAKQNAEGFWEFSFYKMKPIPTEGSGEGMNEFAPDQKKSPAEIMDDEI